MSFDKTMLLGFASTGDKEMPGNLGYWDQLEALKFIHRNAQALGGDQTKLTIYGSSAGAASVTALSISHHSRKMTDRVIAMSGSVFGAWTTSDNVVENTKKLIFEIGVETCETVKECLKRASQADIYRALAKIVSSR
jgi:carboxylesterase type B